MPSSPGSITDRGTMPKLHQTDGIRPMKDDFQALAPDNAFQAKQWIATLSGKLAQQGIVMREPPEEPTSCCGRGCNGCVWEGYYHAVGYWCEQAQEALQKKS